MDTEMPPTGDRPALPHADDLLAAALEAQGEPGVRALGLLQDARRALTGTGLVRPAEVAAACVRSAADTLLKLPGAPESVGLQAAAQDLLGAVDALRPPPATLILREPRRRRARCGNRWRRRPRCCAASWTARAATTGAGPAASSSI